MLTGRIWSGWRLSGRVGMAHHIDDKEYGEQHPERQHDDAAYRAVRRGGLRLSSCCFQLRHNSMLQGFLQRAVEEVLQDTKRAFAQVLEQKRHHRPPPFFQRE